MSNRVKMRRTRIEHMSAGLPPITEIARRGWHGRKVPKPAVSSRSKTSALFDHLIGGGEQRWWHGEAQHPCRRVIDDKLELGGLHDWQVGRFCTLEDATGID